MVSLLAWASSLLLFGQSYCSTKVVSLTLHGRKREIAGASLDTRDVFSASLQNYIPGNQYYVTVGVGSPAQVLELAVVTGAGDTWMFGVDSCKESSFGGPCLGGQFDASKSHTYSIFDNLGPFELEYVDGTTAKGHYFHDKLTVGGVTIPRLPMGLALDSNNISIGALGLGFQNSETRAFAGKQPYANLPALLRVRGVTISNSYSLYLDDIADSTGQIIFGGYDLEKFSGDLTFFPVQNDPYSGAKDGWRISMTNFGISNQSGSYLLQSSHDPYPIPVLIDSGTTIIWLPLELFKPFIALFDLTQSAGSDEFDSWYVDCNKWKTVYGFVLFSFGTSDHGKTIAVPYKELILPYYNSDTGEQYSEYGIPLCQFAMKGMDLGKSPTLGMAFLRSAYALFDLDNPSVALAQANFNTEKSNIVEFLGYGRAKNLVTDSFAPPAQTVNYLAPSYTQNINDAVAKVTSTDRVYSVAYPTAVPATSVAPKLVAASGAIPTQTATPSSSGGRSLLGVYVGAPIAVVVIAALIIIFFLWRRRRAKKAKSAAASGAVPDEKGTYGQIGGFDSSPSEILKSPAPTYTSLGSPSPFSGYSTETMEKGQIQLGMSHLAGVVPDTLQAVELEAASPLSEMDGRGSLNRRVELPSPPAQVKTHLELPEQTNR